MRGLQIPRAANETQKHTKCSVIGPWYSHALFRRGRFAVGLMTSWSR